MTEEFVKKVLEQHKQTLEEAEFTYQVTFCETKYCHRYINFEVDAEQQAEFDGALKQFVDEQK